MSENKVKCPCCRRLFRPVTVRDRTCRRPECVTRWRNEIRYRDDEARLRHEVARAKYIIRHPDRHGPVSIAHAHELLDSVGEKL